ncbi:MAG TPA: T9SS type A sorting domain-containing protein [Bacteroidia bacterium]|nr:T9SS type A sorting domain-containing protein [Bacteroidia bacterium]
MKKLLLSGLALSVCLSVFAQNARVQVQSKLNPATANKVAKIQRPVDQVTAPLRAVNPSVVSHRNAQTEVIIGTTVYDLQSNYGTCGNRIKVWDDGTISAVWTKGDQDPSFADRGTGYNYYNGSSWAPSPTARVESFKTGWPNVSGTSSSGEMMISHGNNASLGAQDTSGTNITYRMTKGAGSWTSTPLGNVNNIMTNFTWPRLVVGGANGNTLHAIGNENGGSFYVYYSRSDDGGATWAVEQQLLPDMSTDFFEGPVDAYEITARGDVIAIVAGGFAEDLTLWKSTDNGQNWTKTTINHFPLAPFDYNTGITDVDGDGIADTVFTTDSGPAVLIDNNDMVHVVVGLMRVLDDDPTGGVSYFPGTDGLLYWNESMPAGDITNNVIAAIEDIDGSGAIEIPGGIALYQCSLTGMPSLGLDAANNIHLVYSSIIENTTNGNPIPELEEAYRNVYYMNSADGGTTWSTPTRVEPSDFDEQVWPNMAKKVDDCVSIIYHKDGEPGNTFQPSTDAGGNEVPDPYGSYDVIYNCIPNPFVGIAENNLGDVKSTIYPNPVQEVMNVDYTLTSNQKMKIQLVNVLGEVVYTDEVAGVTGVNHVKINVRGFASGIYSLNTTVGTKIYGQKVVVR